ncbi:MAG: ABC transporter ATP-binding protein [Clostridia bacterium]|nr:ABC transporter ATP-binding protein [Clostridia bacterium]
MSDNKKTSIRERMGEPFSGNIEHSPAAQQQKQQSLPMGPRRVGPRGGMPAEKPKDVKATILKLLKYIGRSRFQLIGLILIMLLTTALTLAGPALQGSAINTVGDIIRQREGAFDTLIKTLMTMAGVYILSSFFTWLQGILSAKVSQTTVYTLRRDLFKKISYLPIKYTDTHAHGDLMSRMTNDVDNISMTVSQSITSLISSVLTLFGSLFMIIWFSRKCLVMALVTVCTIPLTILATMLLTKKMSKFFVERQKLLGQLNGHVEEMVTGYKTVMAYGREDIECEMFAKTSERLHKVGIKAAVWSGIMGPVNNFINNFNYLLVVACGALFVSTGALLPGGIQSIIQYSKQFSMPLSQLANEYTMILTAVAGAERVFEVLESEDEVDEGTLHLDPASIKGNIEFKNIDFSYVPEKQVLHNFNLSVKAGQKIAIVGATGSGKTTVVNLLTRFYDPDSGYITLDGVDIRDIPKEELRSNIAIVLQDTVLFSDTIDANIRYGNNDACDSEVEAAARTANAHSFIRHLPDGYKTVLAESGSNLSQGQRQLLSIARAVLADPKILILDEATSSVDTRTEMHIQSAMFALMKGRTSLIIAHRLSTIIDADVIVVVRDGTVVESGSHSQLLEKGGEYASLYKNQFAGFST